MTENIERKIDEQKVKQVLQMAVKIISMFLIAVICTIFACIPIIFMYPLNIVFHLALIFSLIVYACWAIITPGAIKKVVMSIILFFSFTVLTIYFLATFDNEVFCEKSGACIEGINIKYKDQIISINKENCEKNNWIWVESGSYCQVQDNFSVVPKSKKEIE